jgi:hypothetical protein
MSDRGHDDEQSRIEDDGPDDIDTKWWAGAFDGAELGEFEAPEVLRYALARMLDGEDLSDRQREVIQALAKVTSAMLEPTDWVNPFRPAIQNVAGRSILPSDLEPEEIALLARLAPMIEQRSLQARVADAAWVYGDRSNTALLDLAVNAYRSMPLTADVWHSGGKDSWQRAFEILARRRSNTSALAEEMADALSTAVLGMGAGDQFLIIDFAKTLRKNTRPHPTKTTVIAEHLVAVAASGTASAQLCRALEREAAAWFRPIDPDRSRKCVERAGRAYIAEADARLAADPKSGALVEGHFIEDAIGLLRTLPRRYREAHGIEDLLDELRQRLSASRERTLESMIRFESDPVDLSEYITHARATVSGETSSWRALVKFASLMPSMDEERIRTSARDLVGGSLSRIFGSATFAQDGRKVAARPSSVDGADDGAVWAVMVGTISGHAQIVTQGMILPALEVLTFEHAYRNDFLVSVCVETPFVPEGHERLWSTGLQSGLTGDFGTAVVILVPQLEHAIRVLVKRRGAHTLVVDDQGIESEKSLGPLLDLPEAAAVLGGGMVMELKALLVDQQAANLRNTIAHGLIDDARAWSYDSAYVWWLCLRLVVQPLWLMTDQTDEADDPDGAVDDTAG